MAAHARETLWASGHDESVEVNQRALIDKVLARYSGEFTVFRELLQNSDDAQSRAVEIHFATKRFIEQRDGKMQVDVDRSGAAVLDVKTTMVHQWTFKNNGIIFRDEDWSRLKKIAEGNPDEEKIGAFGVGFYSLFSVTEEPFVTSGDQWMGFYWKDKKDQLYARRGTLPEMSRSPWTSFDMVLRDPAPIPSAFDFIRFLTSSITFMSHLCEISVFFDDKRLARLTKAAGVPVPIEIPRGLQLSSRQGVMNTMGVKTAPLTIKAEIMRLVYSAGSDKPAVTTVIGKQSKPSSFFSSLLATLSPAGTPQRTLTPLPKVEVEAENPNTIYETNVTLSIFSADVRVQLPQTLANELFRATKKNPPNRLKYELIYTAKDEYDASVLEDARQSFATGSVFQGLRADLEGAGSTRIFIGHATGQTTGLGGHMASRFIPTVERESVDLVDRHVAVWNRELLYVGGFLARVAYELEMTNVRELWQGASSVTTGPSREFQESFTKRSLHALKFFSFHPSTPSSDVSNLMEAAFFSCRTDQSFSIISSVGMRNASEVRLRDAVFTPFLKQLPVLPDEVSTAAPSLVASLQNRGIIKPITFIDVLAELRSRPLREAEMTACLKWWIGLHDQGMNSNLPAIRTELLNAAVLSTGDLGTAEEKIIPLSSITHYINPKTTFVHLGGPMPPDTIPQSITQSFNPESLALCFPWTELSIVDWLRHLTNTSVTAEDAEHDINRSAPWAERVLLTLSRSWPSLPNVVKEQLVALLKDQTCIPTTSGLKIPEQAYFANANVFKDLPIVKLPSGTLIKGAVEKVLLALGVRKHVDLQLVFNRMIKTGDWTIADLIKYLVAVRSTLNEEEMQRLRMTPAFLAENVAPPAGTTPKAVRLRAVDLYEPNDIFRQLKLPVIDWGVSKWSAKSDEAKFLFELGLLRYPPLEVLVGLCANHDLDVRSTALRYFLDNVSTRYPHYDPANFGDVAFIPSTTRLGTPKEVFSNPEWAHFGLLVVHPGLQFHDVVKLRLKEHPSASLLVDLLAKSPPTNHAEAVKLFGILATRLADFTAAQLIQLSNMPFVPVSGDAGPDAKGVRWLPPNQCFFGNESEAHFHSKLFLFVDFGALANNFLSACGAKSQPSVEEVVQILLADPRKFYELADGRDNFLAELRNIAVNARSISSATMMKLRKAPVLLGAQRILHSRASSNSHEKHHTEDDDDDAWEIQYDLKRPDQIVIADDNNMYQVFGDSIFTAPQEDILEDFYQQLGSRRLTTLVKEEYKTSTEIRGSKTAVEVRSLILERLPLFLHEHTHARRTRVTFGWLNSSDHFLVKMFGRLTVTKTLSFGDVRLSRTQDTSAVAKRVGFGAIHLWLAANAQTDMYEVATSLCSLLFESPKAHDTLLLMTILSTDLRSLKRRGYNVDRILKQQKAQRLVSEAKLHEESTSPRLGMTGLMKPTPEPTTPAEQEPNFPQPPSQFMHNLRQRFSQALNNNQQASPPIINDPPQDQSITPRSNIASNIAQAIKACTPETHHLLQNREQMQWVKESLDEGYCDISGRSGDLTLIGKMGGVRIYTSQEVPNPQSILTTKHDALARFIHIIQPLAQLYSLPLTTLQIFYDIKGDTIAFNRNASIFLNLRYFEAWHDEDVSKGVVHPAYISWFFTLAHEIAHNLVQPHNSEHEFYFSAICEKYVGALAQLLR